jgi:flagellar basal body-associated protein FliL
MMRGGADEEEEETKASTKPPVFLPLDQFTVNLQPEESQQFLQVAMTLKVVDQAIADKIKAVMPEVRSRVLLLLSSKKPSQISSLAGKGKLAEEIIHEIEQTMPVEKKKKKKKKKKAKSEDAEEKTEATAENKDAKSKKSKAKDDEEEEEDDLPERVEAVFFTHFIVQ